MIISPISVAIVGAIVLFMVAAFYYAFAVLFTGESSYDPKARREAVWAAIIALLLGGLVVLFFVLRILAGFRSIN